MATIIFLFIAAFLLLSLLQTAAQIGVCYGRLGDNLPCAQDVVDFYDFYEIGAMRIYDPDQATLKALQRTNIKLMLGVPNEDIIGIAKDQSTANKWVETNVVPFASSIKYIVVGNEIRPSYPQASSMEPAMQNILKALNSNKLTNIIVSTAIDSSLLINTFPPSHSEFKDLSYITPIIRFLTTNDWPLIANIEPYAAYINDPRNISLDFVLFTSCEPKFIDDKTGKGYQNLFDALYDSVYVAIQKVVQTVDQHNSRNGVKKPAVGESSYSSKGKFPHGLEYKGRRLTRKEMNKGTSNCGYPKGSGEPGTVEYARIFYTNMIKHVKKGTPLTQGQELEVYLFAMFDENQKKGDMSEQHYGLFTPDGFPKYGILNFCNE